MSHSNQQVSEAAASILALINSKPQSPRQDELEAIISDAIDGTGALSILAAKRARWRKAVADLDAAIAIVRDMTVDDPGEAQASAAADAASDRVLGIEAEMYRTTVSGWADVGILGEVCFRQVWPADDLHGLNSDKLLAGEPECEMHDKAICALLKAIRLLSRPRGLIHAAIMKPKDLQSCPRCPALSPHKRASRLKAVGRRSGDSGHLREWRDCAGQVGRAPGTGPYLCIAANSPFEPRADSCIAT
jgi:hypothetical protein